MLGSARSFEPMSTTDTQRPDAVPGVLAVIVARDGVASLKDCLRGLAAQTHPRLGVVAVHAGRAGGREILEKALGPQRVFEDTTDTGVAGALRLVGTIPAAEAADFLLIVHDDTALEADAVARLVDAARTIDGVGVVGPKIVDWDDPRVLRDIGASADGFGHRYVALQDGERDQGQYDRVLEVLAVSSAAMLLTREAWKTSTPFDERLEGHHEDLDFCWRVRLAGFRVVMTPLAMARHRGMPGRGERVERFPRSSRYYAERSALAMLLKAPGRLRVIPSLLLYLVYAGFRTGALALTRRFEDAFEIGGAFAWNVGHLPGTLARRRQAQGSRRVKDAAVVRFLSSPFHVPRWFERAEELLERQLDEDVEEAPEARPRRPFRERALSAAIGHPVLSAGILGFLVTWIGFRKVRDAAVLTGGALAAFPRGTSSFFSELSAPVRTTLLGGGDAASPFLAALGSASLVAFGNGARAQRWFLMALLPTAIVLAYRALRRRRLGPWPAIAAAAAYGLSGALLWSFSEGRIPLLVLAAVLPVAWERLEAFGTAEALEPRLIVGLAMGFSAAFMALPGALLAILLLVAVHVVGARRSVGARSALLAVGAGLALAFPLLLEALRAPTSVLGSSVAPSSVGEMLRFVAGIGPGTGWTAFFLPIAAAIAYSFVDEERRGSSTRALVTSLASVGLAWLSASRLLPGPLANAPVYLVVGAFAASLVIAEGLAAFVADAAARGFGLRQVTAAVLAVVLALGLGAQTLQVAVGEWAVGRDGLPAAWPIVSSEAGDFRILWIGAADGRPFPAPGGDPQGVIAAGDASIRYALTDRDGTSALDLGRGQHGPGYDYLRSVLRELVAGASEHVGAMLAPLAVRFVVTAEDDLPPEVLARLAEQADVDAVPAGGIAIYRNARAIPIASIETDPLFASAAGVADAARLAPKGSVELARAGAGWSGDSSGGTGFLSVQDDGGWRAGIIEGERAFGWAVRFEALPGPVAVRHRTSIVRLLELVALAGLWAAALWATRRPVSA